MPRRTQTNQETLLPSLQKGSRLLDRYASSLAVESAVSRDGEYMLREASMHQLAMKIHVLKTGTAMRQAGQLQIHTSQVFHETCEGIDAVGEVAAAGKSKQYVEQLGHHLKDQYAAHLAGMYDECAERLRTEAGRPVSLSAPPEQKRGLWQALWGG